MTLRVLIVAGIWPPDVGGPASHGPELGRFLLARGHEVRAVIGAGPDGPDPSGVPVIPWRRDRPRLVRMGTGAVAVAAAARWPDVVYSTGMYYKSALAAALNRVPLVVKLTTDPAFERCRRLGLFRGDIAAFQQPQRGAAIRYLKEVRSALLSRAVQVLIPSRFLADFALGWGLPADRVTVVPNPAPPVGRLPPREEMRRRLGMDGPTFAFAGRLVAAKNLPLAIAALARVPGARLIIIGDGPERQRLHRGRRSGGSGRQDRVEGRTAAVRGHRVAVRRRRCGALERLGELPPRGRRGRGRGHAGRRHCGRAAFRRSSRAESTGSWCRPATTAPSRRPCAR